MQLLNLINGFPGAPSGTAEVFVSGSTASLATVYADAAGTATLTNPVVLDANGSATAYVDTTVDVVIKTSTGAIAKARHTPEIVDAMIETSGPSFTGANPVTGALAVNQPIGLDTVLDRWKTSAGAPDWKVRRTGQSADETIVAALAALTSSSASLFFNVKSYGAVGNGATDDATSFEATVAAAIAAGGGIVFVPASATNYVLSRSIAIVSPKVSFLGAGPLGSVLSVTSAVPALAWTGGVTTGTQAFCQGIGFTASSGFTTTAITAASCPGFTVRMCRFNTVSVGGGAGIINATTRINVEQCSFATATAGTGHAVYTTGVGSKVDGCTLEATCVLSGIAFPAAQDMWINNCTHEAGASSLTLINDNTSVRIKVTNCHAITGKWIWDNLSNATVIEYGNTFADTISTTGAMTGGVFRTTGGSNSGLNRLGSRIPYVAVAAGASYTPRAEIVTHDLTITAALAMSAFIGAVSPGDTISFVVFNNTAGALNVTWNAAYNVSASPTSVAAAQRMRLDFVFVTSTTARAMDVASVFA